MGSGVEDHLGGVALHQLGHLGAVLNVGNDKPVGYLGRDILQFHLQFEKAVLTPAHQDDLLGEEPGELPDDLGAYGPPGPGYHYPFPGEVAGDGFHVEGDLLAAQEVGHVDVADVGDVDGAGEDFVYAGNYPVGDLGFS